MLAAIVSSVLKIMFLMSIATMGGIGVFLIVTDVVDGFKGIIADGRAIKALKKDTK